LVQFQTKKHTSLPGQDLLWNLHVPQHLISCPLSENYLALSTSGILDVLAAISDHCFGNLSP
jgi:hypothetical protein